MSGGSFNYLCAKDASDLFMGGLGDPTVKQVGVNEAATCEAALAEIERCVVVYANHHRMVEAGDLVIARGGGRPLCDHVSDIERRRLDEVAHLGKNRNDFRVRQVLDFKDLASRRDNRRLIRYAQRTGRQIRPGGLE